MAKESVVSNADGVVRHYGSASWNDHGGRSCGASRICLLYTPCVAAVASIKRELGGKWAFFVVIGQCVIAWLAAFAVHTVAMLF